MLIDPVKKMQIICLLAYDNCDAKGSITYSTIITFKELQNYTHTPEANGASMRLAKKNHK
jgi:hypothetical protein